ncbi:hypothetical protein [Nostoc sp. UHCC 0251]|uniref:hypothetical protein n=1 Tax=Nostoc sp. UHCC 0251 TaxID=3110240 RepID=UPI002B1E930E|nr:hypothetical protein [Nostoc sp. UHCC 0251]MEA5625777.1 hypothetical protein [Nostoc sp. UHCC 0251]
MVDSFPSDLPDFDVQLQQLVNRIQQYLTQSQERQQALSELVDAIMRSHRFCRPSKLFPLVVQKISLDLQKQLLHDISQNIDGYNPQRIPIREWANSLRHRALKTILSDNIIINQIAQEAKNAAPDSNQRRLALNLLVEAIQIADKFYHFNNGSFSFSPGLYKYIYNEAIQETLLYVCLNIHQYDPSRGHLMTWVNFLLSKRFSDVRDKYMKQGITKLPKISKNITDEKQSGIKIVSLDNAEILEIFWQKEEAAFESKQLRDLIESDPDSVFSNAHITGRPDVNFKVVALEKVWGDKTWEYLADKWQIDSIQTLSSFFNRCLKKFRSTFQEYLQD